MLRLEAGLWLWHPLRFVNVTNSVCHYILFSWLERWVIITDENTLLFSCPSRARDQGLPAFPINNCAQALRAELTMPIQVSESCHYLRLFTQTCSYKQHAHILFKYLYATFLSWQTLKAVHRWIKPTLIINNTFSTLLKKSQYCTTRNPTPIKA